jgi:hypothetical protein
MPVNRRTEAHAALPAANVLGFEAIDRRAGADADPAELHAGIRRETSAVKQRRTQSWLDDWVGVLNGAPLLLDALLGLPTSLYTGIVSNLGSPAERGAWSHLPRRDGRVEMDGLVVAAFGFAPPVRPRSPLSLGVTTYGGELAVTGKASPQTVGRAGLERFLDELGRRLREATG